MRAKVNQRDKSEHDAEAEHGRDGEEAAPNQEALRQAVIEIVEVEHPGKESVKAHIKDDADEDDQRGGTGDRQILAQIHFELPSTEINLYAGRAVRLIARNRRLPGHSPGLAPLHADHGRLC